ncbi:MAG: NADH-quinone oxidoreductase subunit N, partial [Pseudomonadota bacterium]
MTYLDMTIAAPELLLAAVGLFGVLIGAIIGDGVSSVSRAAAAASLAAAAVLSAMQIDDGVLTAFNGLYQTTPFIAFAKAVALGVGAGALFMAGGYLKREGLERYEYALLAVFSGLGIGVMLSSNNLMTLYMGVETLSLSSYVLAAFNRDSRRSAEAGLKYFVLGALASGLLLFGASLVYGYTGAADYAGIAEADMTVGLTFGLVLMLIGLAFKASAAPFHIWTPDVYEGAPTPVVAFFATAPKIAAVALFAHIMFNVFGAFEDAWKDIVAIVAALSMMIGALGALGQYNIKRLLAYSSIANVGFALMGVAAGEALGAPAVLVYMTIYVATTLGIFGGVLAMRRRDGMVEDV